MNRNLYLLPGLSIILVVFVHACNYGVIAATQWVHQFQFLLPVNYDPFRSSGYLVSIFFNRSMWLGVPAFFFVSGYFSVFVANRPDSHVVDCAIRNRIKKLLIPYVIWSIALLVFRLIDTRQILSWYEYVLFIVLGVNGYWFTPGLILFYAISPWLVKQAKAQPERLILAAFAVQMLPAASHFLWMKNISDPNMVVIAQTTLYWSMISWACYFPLGIVMGVQIEGFKKFLYRFRYWFLGAMVVCVIVIGMMIVEFPLGITNDPIDFFLFEISQILALVALFGFLAFPLNKLPLKNYLNKLNNDTYGIYLTHQFFIIIMAKLFYHYAPAIMAYNFIFVVILFAAGMAGSLFVINLSKKVFPSRVNAYLFG